MTKAQIVSGEFRLPPSEFEFSDFKVITWNDDTPIVTYRVRGTDKTPLGPGFSIYATSVWVRRGGEWKTIFYQATKTE